MTASVLTSKLTKRSQTTIPKAVKNALHVAAGDEIGYVIEGESVRLVNVAMQAENEDPMVEQFLGLLAKDIGQGRVRAFPQSLYDRIEQLTASVTVDHDADITGAIRI